MIPIDCPLCGPRQSSEFAFWGDVRPAAPPPEDVRVARRALHLRDNPSGWARERWLHVVGCGRFLELERHRTTNETRPLEGSQPDSAAGP